MEPSKEQCYLSPETAVRFLTTQIEAGNLEAVGRIQQYVQPNDFIYLKCALSTKPISFGMIEFFTSRILRNWDYRRDNLGLLYREITRLPHPEGLYKKPELAEHMIDFVTVLYIKNNYDLSNVYHFRQALASLIDYRELLRILFLLICNHDYSQMCHQWIWRRIGDEKFVQLLNALPARGECGDWTWGNFQRLVLLSPDIAPDKRPRPIEGIYTAVLRSTTWSLDEIYSVFPYPPDLLPLMDQMPAYRRPDLLAYFSRFDGEIIDKIANDLAIWVYGQSPESLALIHDKIKLQGSRRIAALFAMMAEGYLATATKKVHPDICRAMHIGAILPDDLQQLVALLINDQMKTVISPTIADLRWALLPR